MSQVAFIGRKQPLERLKQLYNKQRASLVVVKGRRRVGKSRLIAEFAAQNSQSTFWSFAGIAPQEGGTAQTQRDIFARRLTSLSGMPPMTFMDWSDAFEHLSCQIKAGDIILLDEISWMGMQDPTFIRKRPTNPTIAGFLNFPPIR